MKRLIEIFWIFAAISAVTLGGGLAMLPLISREFSERRKWMTDAEIMDTIAAAQSLPGLMAPNASVMIGFHLEGFKGAFAALAGCVAPPFIAIVLLAGIVARLRSFACINGLFLGIRAAACAVILALLVSMIKKHCRNWIAILLAVLSFVLIGFFGFNAIWIILACIALSPLVAFLNQPKSK